MKESFTLNYVPTSALSCLSCAVTVAVGVAAPVSISFKKGVLSPKATSFVTASSIFSKTMPELTSILVESRLQVYDIHSELESVS